MLSKGPHVLGIVDVKNRKNLTQYMLTCYFVANNQ